MKTIFCIFSIMLFLLSSVTAVFAGGNDNVENLYFSINVPDNWAYKEYSDTPESRSTGFGLVNIIELTPNEFSDILVDPAIEKIRQDGSPFAIFFQDTNHPKNARLESYVKYQINNYGIQNITSQQYTTVGKEKSVRIYANESAHYGGAKTALYLVMHDKEPYVISFAANEKNYEKYLPEFEQMVKSFRFAGTASSEGDGNLTNTQSNFSGANLTELNTSGTSDSNYPEELYDECVSVAGKSFCDFLFKKNYSTNSTVSTSEFMERLHKQYPQD